VRVGWFSTGRDIAAQQLFLTVTDAIARKTIPGSIEFVFCNREPGEYQASDAFLDVVRSKNVPVETASSKKFKPELRKGNRQKWRKAYDRRVLDLVGDYEADLGVFAGYMLIVSHVLHDSLPLVNLHPALPGGPTGAWQDVVWEVIEKRESQYGAMVHLATEHLDRGPCLAYVSFSIVSDEFNTRWAELDEKLENSTLGELRETEGESNALFTAIREAVAKREIPLIAETLRLLAEGTLAVEDRRVVCEGHEIQGGVCLNDAVEATL
jgi:phosphoribosylglycinamide formyltransferase-1